MPDTRPDRGQTVRNPPVKIEWRGKKLRITALGIAPNHWRWAGRMFDPAHRNEMELARTRAGIVNHITDCGQGSVFAPALEVYAPQRNLIGSMCCARRVRPDLDLHRYAPATLQRSRGRPRNECRRTTTLCRPKPPSRPQRSSCRHFRLSKEPYSRCPSMSLLLMLG